MPTTTETKMYGCGYCHGHHPSFAEIRACGRRGTAGQLDLGPAVPAGPSALERFKAAAAQLPAPKKGHLRFAVSVPGVLDGKLTFWDLRRPTKGRGTGRIFLDRQSSDNFLSATGRLSMEQAARVLETLLLDVKEGLAAYGREIGQCACCGATLTSEWRQRGIGPECHKLYGAG